MASLAPATSAVRPLTLREIFQGAKRPENFWFRIYYGLSSFIVWVAVRAGWTPNQLTLTGALLNLSAFTYFLAAPVCPRSIVIAYVLFNVAHVFDCADGQLAFVANKRSELGYWLDSSLDVFKSAYVSVSLIRALLYVDTNYGVSGGGSKLPYARHSVH